jgi:hypothetical protein
VEESSTAGRIGATAVAGAWGVGATRIKLAFGLLGLMTVQVFILVVTAVAALVLDASWAWSRLAHAGVGWPFGTLIAAAGAVLTVGSIGALWRDRDFASVRLLVAASVVWTVAGAWILAADGTSSPLGFAVIALALVASVVWSRRRRAPAR